MDAPVVTYSKAEEDILRHAMSVKMNHTTILEAAAKVEEGRKWVADIEAIFDQLNIALFGNSQYE